MVLCLALAVVPGPVGGCSPDRHYGQPVDQMLGGMDRFFDGLAGPNVPSPRSVASSPDGLSEGRPAPGYAPAYPPYQDSRR
jgi:hypothetical protein